MIAYLYFNLGTSTGRLYSAEGWCLVDDQEIKYGNLLLTYLVVDLSLPLAGNEAIQVVDNLESRVAHVDATI